MKRYTDQPLATRLAFYSEFKRIRKEGGGNISKNLRREIMTPQELKANDDAQVKGRPTE